MKLKTLLIISSISTFIYATNNNLFHQEYLKAKKQADSINIPWDKFNKALVKQFNSIKQKLPLKQGKNLTLENVNYDQNKKEILFKYQLNSKLPNTNKMAEYKKSLSNYAAVKLCTNPMIIKFFENNGSIIYSYDIVDKNKKTNITLKIDASVCKNKGIW